MTALTTTSLQVALQKLSTWVEKESFAGWDPYDALSSPLLQRATFGSRQLGQAWVQVLKRSPINLRPLLGIRKAHNPKGMGLFWISYLRLYWLTHDERHLQRVGFFGQWLREHTSPRYSGACWGYNFPWPNRSFFAPAGTPTIVNTSFISLFLMDAVQAYASGRAGGAIPEVVRATLPLARSACDFVLHDLNILRPRADELCFSYTPLDERYIHNANVLGARMLAAASAIWDEPYLRDTAFGAARYTARRQRDDGSWAYGEGRVDGWVDNFHTGFVLTSLKRIGELLGSNEFEEGISRGYAFWKERMFLDDGVPMYYPDRIYPIDIHSVAQAILTFLEFADRDPEAQEWAERVAAWSIEHMQDPDGFFHFQIHRRYRIRIPYMRWSQAWMLRALTELMWTKAAAT